ncbi:hypothetical protein IQ06DRAFT_68388 [Phaeosphaeriaceae sp. SRC1lsM3a]|nr:hypothetical protein IQ06DRAFT_68388 [Stagonospora sp. SRC1lsM3a]
MCWCRMLQDEQALPTFHDSERYGKILVRFHAIHQALFRMRGFARRIRLVFHRPFLLHVAGRFVLCMSALVKMFVALQSALLSLLECTGGSVDLNGRHDLQRFEVAVCLLARVFLEHGRFSGQARCLAAQCSSSHVGPLKMKRVKH